MIRLSPSFQHSHLSAIGIAEVDIPTFQLMLLGKMLVYWNEITVPWLFTSQSSVPPAFVLAISFSP